MELGLGNRGVSIRLHFLQCSRGWGQQRRRLSLLRTGYVSSALLLKASVQLNLEWSGRET